MANLRVGFHHPKTEPKYEYEKYTASNDYTNVKMQRFVDRMLELKRDAKSRLDGCDQFKSDDSNKRYQNTMLRKRYKELGSLIDTKALPLMMPVSCLIKEMEETGLPDQIAETLYGSINKLLSCLDIWVKNVKELEKSDRAPKALDDVLLRNSKLESDCYDALGEVMKKLYPARDDKQYRDRQNPDIEIISAEGLRVDSPDIRVSFLYYSQKAKAEQAKLAMQQKQHEAAAKKREDDKAALQAQLKAAKDQALAEAQQKEDKAREIIRAAAEKEEKSAFYKPIYEFGKDSKSAIESKLVRQLREKLSKVELADDRMELDLRTIMEEGIDKEDAEGMRHCANRISQYELVNVAKKLKEIASLKDADPFNPNSILQIEDKEIPLRYKQFLIDTYYIRQIKALLNKSNLLEGMLDSLHTIIYQRQESKEDVLLSTSDLTKFAGSLQMLQLGLGVDHKFPEAVSKMHLPLRYKNFLINAYDLRRMMDVLHQSSVLNVNTNPRKYKTDEDAVQALGANGFNLDQVVPMPQPKSPAFKGRSEAEISVLRPQINFSKVYFRISGEKNYQELTKLYVLLHHIAWLKQQWINQKLDSPGVFGSEQTVVADLLNKSNSKNKKIIAFNELEGQIQKCLEGYSGKNFGSTYASIKDLLKEAWGKNGCFGKLEGTNTLGKDDAKYFMERLGQKLEKLEKEAQNGHPLDKYFEKSPFKKTNLPSVAPASPNTAGIARGLDARDNKGADVEKDHKTASPSAAHGNDGRRGGAAGVGLGLPSPTSGAAALASAAKEASSASSSRAQAGASASAAPQPSVSPVRKPK